MMTFEDLRVFHTVAAERSFSRAARKLNRTQPAVSQAIRRLEQAIGERLIDRSSRDGTLTDAGQLLLEYGGRLLTLADEAGQAVNALREVRRGRVVIGANEAGVYSVLPLVATLMSTYVARDYIAEDLSTAIVLGCVVTVAVFPLLAFKGLTADEASANDEDDESEGEAKSEKSAPQPAS